MSMLEYGVAGNLRTCCRCGSAYRSDSGRRICPGCTVPAEMRKKRPINPELSFREKQVVTLVSHGKPNKEIAFNLHLTEGTIKEYLNRIFRKLGVANRTELAVWAVRHLPQTKVESSPQALENKILTGDGPRATPVG